MAGVFLDLTILAALCSLLGTLLVGSHWTSTWVDREFTGWIAPLAHQVGEGARMYEDGRHSPLPPLPTLLLWALAPRPASWYSESLAIFLFQSGTLAVMYGVIRAVMSRRAALWAVLAGAPVFFSLSKTILYDFMPQFLVAVGLAGVVCWFRSFRKDRPTRATWAWIAAMGGLSATVLLTKQSTGLGFTLGVALTLTIFPRGTAPGSRLASLAVFALAAGAAFGLWCAAIRPLVSVAGMVHDVFLIGSEPKGGARQMVHNLLGYTAELACLCALVGLAALAYRGARRGPAWQASLMREEALRPAQARGLRRLAWGLPLACCVLAGCASAGIHWRGDCASLLFAPQTIGLAVLVGLLALAIFPRKATAAAAGGPIARFARAWFRPPRVRPALSDNVLPPLVLVALVAAAFHNLSASELRWTVDNNPLVILALAALAALVIAPERTADLCRSEPPSAGRACLVAATVLCWTTMIPQWQAARECRIAWPEVSHLRGARLRPKAEGMRELVSVVRRWAPRHDDCVLVLPDDPNVEAWLERPRPALTSSIVFTDQYWDRYVEEDFRRLQADPPRVIVVGPRVCWRPFSRVWHADWGAERLIDCVETRLIADRYRLVGSVAVPLRGMTDYMDVYVRCDEMGAVAQAIDP